MRLLQFRKGQLMAAAALFAIAIYTYPELMQDVPIAIGAAAASYLVGYYLHFAFRRYFFRRVVAFDVGGVLLTGDNLRERLNECPGMRPLLKELRERYIIAILSNNNELVNAGMEKRFGFASLFDEIIYSSQTGNVKPEPQIFMFLLRRFGISASRVVFVDDTPENVETARNLGIKGINFNCNKQGIHELRAALSEAGLKV